MHVEPAASPAEEDDWSDDEEPPAPPPPPPVLCLGYDTDADSQASPGSSYSSCNAADAEAALSEDAEEVILYNPWAQAA